MEFAEIIWDKGVPKSKVFDDVCNLKNYFFRKQMLRF